jgi:hypothetical protein
MCAFGNCGTEDWAATMHGAVRESLFALLEREFQGYPGPGLMLRLEYAWLNLQWLRGAAE